MKKRLMVFLVAFLFLAASSTAKASEEQKLLDGLSKMAASGVIINKYAGHLKLNQGWHLQVSLKVGPDYVFAVSGGAGAGSINVSLKEPNERLAAIDEALGNKKMITFRPKYDGVYTFSSRLVQGSPDGADVAVIAFQSGVNSPAENSRKQAEKNLESLVGAAKTGNQAIIKTEIRAVVKGDAIKAEVFLNQGQEYLFTTSGSAEAQAVDFFIMSPKEG